MVFSFHFAFGMMHTSDHSFFPGQTPDERRAAVLSHRLTGVDALVKEKALKPCGFKTFLWCAVQDSN